MYWTTPTLVEICIGLEINGYLPAEFLIHEASSWKWPAGTYVGGLRLRTRGCQLTTRCQKQYFASER